MQPKCSQLNRMPSRAAETLLVWAWVRSSSSQQAWVLVAVEKARVGCDMCVRMLAGGA